MTDEELEQQDKQEQKEERQEERKKTLKTVITSAICTLLFVVILLLLVILCLKNCSPRPNNDNSSSSSEPEPTWTEYDNPKLTNVFKEIVNTYLDFNMGETKVLKDVMMVDYSDNKEQTKFDLSICVTSNTEEKYVYYYEVENKSYAGFTDPFTFLLDEHTDLFLDEVAHFETYKELNIAPLILSCVSLVESIPTISIFLPLYLPEIMRIKSTLFQTYYTLRKMIIQGLLFLVFITILFSFNN